MLYSIWSLKVYLKVKTVINQHLANLKYKMVRRKIPLKDKEFIYNRANGICEYCHRKLHQGEIWEAEHIKPSNIGGSNNPENLAVACTRCNKNKSSRTDNIDPITGLSVPLFNPRETNWETHFKQIQNAHTDTSKNHNFTYIVGITSIGRATAELLFHSTEQSVLGDSRWSRINIISNEGLYNYLNKQRIMRLTNQFNLIKTLDDFRTTELYSNATPCDKNLAEIAINIIILEMHMTRSQKTDIWKGIEIAKNLLEQKLHKSEEAEWHNHLAVLYQQQATFYMLAGKPEKARRYQEASSHHYYLSISRKANVETHEKLRMDTINTKYSDIKKPNYKGKDISYAIDNANNGDLRAITYLADSELHSLKKSQYFEKVACHIEEAISKCGYGQDYDYAKTVVLRRRWWAFKILSNDKYDLDLFSKDINFWNSIKMFNEIRELKLLLIRIEKRHKIKQIKDMLEILK